MFCKNCGMQIPSDAQICPGCGTAASGFCSGAEAVKKLFSQPLYLALCIVLTVAAAVGITNGNVMAVLFAVAAWLTYGNAVSAASPLKAGGYKFTAVVLKIQYIAMWVVAGVAATVGLVGGILFMFVGSFASFLAGGAIDYSADLSPEIAEFIDTFVRFLLKDGAWIAGIAFIITMGAITAAVIVFNQCFIRHFCDYAANLANAVKNGETDSFSLYDKGLSTRLMVMGIIGAASVAPLLISSFAGNNASSAVANVGAFCIAASYILASVLIKNSRSDAE